MSDSKNKLKIKQSGIMNIRGKEVATYPAMIDYAHQCGMQSLEATVLQFPHESNDMRTICGARLVTSAGQVFADIGDASPDNVPKVSNGIFSWYSVCDAMLFHALCLWSPHARYNRLLDRELLFPLRCECVQSESPFLDLVRRKSPGRRFYCFC